MIESLKHFSISIATHCVGPFASSASITTYGTLFIDLQLFRRLMSCLSLRQDTTTMIAKGAQIGGRI